MNEIGTLAWARRTRGAMSRSEQLAYFRAGLATQLDYLTDWAAFTLGIRRERIRLELDSLVIPDTAAARDAEAACDELPPYMFQHSHRTYIWATALARAERLDYDAELLYCASLIHDTGLFAGDTEPACFTLASATRASECADHGGWPPERRDQIAEAITLHLNPSVAPEQSVEGHLLAAGATLDAVALRRRWRIHPESVAAVLERHPRHDMKRELKRTLKQHVHDFPRGRVGFLWRYGGLPLMVSTAPFEE